MANNGKIIPGLKNARNKANLTQEMLATKIGTTKKSVMNWESGVGCTKKWLDRLCTVLSVDMTILESSGSPEVKTKEVPFELNNISTSVADALLTDEQRKVVHYAPENLKVLAGAGAGKTTTMSTRILNLMLDYGIKASEIVIITFTEKAALEIRERLSHEYQLKHSNLKGFDDIFVGTIHQYCYHLIRKGLHEYLSYDLLDGTDQFVFAQRYYNELLSDLSYEERLIHGKPIGLEKLDGQTAGYGVSLRLLLPLLGVMREGDINMALVSDSIKQVLARYKKLLKDKKKLDFSSLLEITLSNLRDNDNFKALVASDLKYLIVDEYQDTNTILEKVIAELVRVSGAKITVVGDDDQSIYGWNNAQIHNLIDFDKRYPNVETIIFPDNFRSTSGVIDTAYRIVGENTGRIPKSITAKSHHQSEDGDILALEFGSPLEEAKWIGERVNTFLGYPFKDKVNSEERGLSYSDMAVLVRTKSQAQYIISRFEESGIPYEFKGASGIVSGSKLGKALAYIFYYLSGKKVQINSNNDHKALITNKCLYKAWFDAELGLSQEKINNAIKSLDHFKAKKMTLSSHSLWAPQNALHVFLAALKLREESVPNKNSQAIMSAGEQAFLTIGQFSSMLSKFEQHHVGRQKASSVYKDLAGYLEFSADSNFLEENRLSSSRDVISILTMHSAKGLEWPMVFIPGMTKNRFPKKRNGGLNLFHFIDKCAFTKPEIYRTPIDEERRLAFVAMTRSKKFLFMSWANEGNNIYKEPSPFLLESRLSADNYVYDKFDENDYRQERLEPKANIQTDIVSIPFSAIFDHRSCPYSHRLRWVYGFSPVYNEKIGFGNIMHNVLNDYHQQRLNQGKKWTDAELPALIKKHFHLPFGPTAKMKELLEASLLKRIERHHKDYGQLDGIQYIEKDITYYSDKVRLDGRLDMLRYFRGGNEEIIDFKSSDGGVHDDKEGPIFQMLSYALGHEINTGKAPEVVKAITLNPEGAPTVNKRKVDKVNLRDTKLELEKYIGEIQRGEAPKRPCNTNKCSVCQVKVMCHQQQN
ncbi:UvrD-helicase domain-containing protein [Photobacterium leiognathi]|uniref:UvrD-helicase domain-containing protein n=1 Tax=Photobacterium leiognathi TaxID=553611 RepID=UPI002981F394|nr:UvrD-helicase domain-containing protein [Photobacterium leiognathi]